MGEIDPAYIQSLEHRPKLTNIEAQGIPQIDLAYLKSPDYNINSQDSSSLVRDIGDACRNWGFFIVVNHGVLLEKYERLEVAAREFFALPMEEKRLVRRDEVNPYGYYDGELTKNVRDWKEVFDLTVMNPTVIPSLLKADDLEVKELVNRWPEYPPELREAFKEYSEEMEKLSLKLLRLISLSLGMAENRLGEFFDNHTSFMRLNHYPPCPNPLLALGVGRHKDGGALTILAQDKVGGLEVKRKSDGEWVRVKPTHDAYIVNVGDIIQIDAFRKKHNSVIIYAHDGEWVRVRPTHDASYVVNVGDITQVWSNETYESVEHRVVVNSDKERFSIPFFFNPDQHVMVEPLSELVTDKNPAKYKVYNWGKFFTTRKQSNFKKLDVENIQISDFRITE